MSALGMPYGDMYAEARLAPTAISPLHCT